MKLRALLFLAGTAMCQSLPQDRLRMGMVEVGARAWNVAIGQGESMHSVGLAGVSVSGFVTDNVSVGGLLAALDDRDPIDVFCLDAMARAYFFPLSRSTPWMELRFGGLFQPAGSSGATHLGFGFGWRWRPLEWMALDLQFAGFERWGYNDPSEASNGNSDWSLQKGPLLASLSGKDGIRLWPAPSVQFLF